jgi:hypothetical protein
VDETGMGWVQLGLTNLNILAFGFVQLMKMKVLMEVEACSLDAQ